MRHFKLTLAYDGGEFAGWQRQPTQRTVQGVVEDAWRAVTGVRSTVIASGRTDAGVHALGQVASVAGETRLPPERLWRALNAHLPDDVRILEVLEAPFGFHALRDTVRKRYRYVLQDGLDHDVIGRRYAWHVRRRLDARAMHEAGRVLIGRHDFSSFESTGSQRLSSVRTVFDLTVERRKIDLGERVVLEVEADGFLYNMVRNITGTLLAVGQGKESADWVARALEARDRTRSGMAAPPHGLFLLRVDVELPQAWDRSAAPPSDDDDAQGAD